MYNIYRVCADYTLMLLVMTGVVKDVPLPQRRTCVVVKQALAIKAYDVTFAS